VIGVRRIVTSEVRTGAQTFVPTLELFLIRNVEGGVEPILGPLGTSATSGLLYLPRVIVRMESLVE
jgi:hypothetical protein